jgi:hypothetical protein
MAKAPPWSEEENELLRCVWRNPLCSSADLVDILHRSVTGICAHANKLGLEKRREFKPRLISSCDGVSRFLVRGDGGHIVTLDTDRADWFLSLGWVVHRDNGGGRYVYSNARPAKKLHRLILGLEHRTPIVDHINRDGLDNRRCNLRIATHAQNLYNARKHHHAKSDFKGVWQHISGLYGGAIKDHDGRRRSIGYYKTQRAAARAHDALARHYRGEFAFQNLPDDLMSADEIAANVSLSREFARSGPRWDQRRTEAAL